MGSRVRVSSGPPTKEKRGFDNIETSFLFMLFHLQKIWLFASCSVRRPPDYRQSKSVYCELCQITEFSNYCLLLQMRTLWNQVFVHTIYSADSLLTQIVLFISQKPFRLPFLRSIMPFSVRLIVMVLTVLSDLPMCVAISFCVAFGRSCKKFSTAISSKVQFKVQILHFEVWFVKMCGDKATNMGFELPVL